MIAGLLSSAQFHRYLLIGGTGFLCDVAGMEALVALGLNAYVARAISIPFVIFLTYFLHKKITYRDEGPHALGKFAGFVTCQGMASALNYAVFFCLLCLLPQPPDLKARLFAFCAGVGAGLVANYFLLGRFVYNADETLRGFLSRMARNRRVWVWGVLCALMSLSALAYQQQALLLPRLPQPLGPWDPDNWMRLSKVRDWLSGAGFFDRGVPRTNAPAGGILTPWTRPVDALLAFLARLMPQGWTLDQKLLVASGWMPALLGLGAIFFLNRAALQLRNNLHVMIVATVLMVVNAIFQNYFSPGSADHHGLLILLWCGVLAFLLSPAPMAPLLAGAFLGTMLWVSPETIMLVALVYTVLGASALLRPKDMRGLSLLALSAAAVTMLGLVAEVPPSEYLSRLTYDSLSIAHVTLMSLSAVTALILSALWSRGPGFRLRCMSAAIVCGGTLGFFLLLFPRFLLGPMADVDVFVMESFLPTISEARSLFHANLHDMMIRLALPALALGLSLHACVTRRRRWRHAALFVFLAATFVMVVFQMRWNYYLQPVSIVIVAAQLPVFARRARGLLFGWLAFLPAQLRAYAWLFAFLGLVAMADKALASPPPANSLSIAQCQSQARLAVQSGALQAALGEGPMIVMAHPNIGGEIIFFTPYRLIAGNYHREGAGLRDLHDIVTAKTAPRAQRLLAARKVDAVFVCPQAYKEDSWLHDLGRRTPDWMTRIDIGPSETGPLLFRIKKKG